MTDDLGSAPHRRNEISPLKSASVEKSSPSTGAADECSSARPTPAPPIRIQPPQKILPEIAGYFAPFVTIEVSKPENHLAFRRKSARPIPPANPAEEVNHAPKWRPKCRARTIRSKSEAFHGRLQRKKTGKTGENAETETRKAFVFKYLRLSL